MTPEPHVPRPGLWRSPTVLQPRGFPDTRPSLLAALRKGEPAQSAWRNFFARYAPAVYRVARRQGLDPHDADDVVQQVMLALSAHIGEFKYDRDRGKFRQWVKTVAANKVRDLYRHRGAAPDRARGGDVEVCPDDGPTIHDLWEQEWKAQDMHYCLDQVREEIAPRRFEAFRLYVLEGVPAEQTARQTGLTRAHVYVTRTQVVKRIREMMGKLEEEEGNRQ